MEKLKTIKQWLHLPLSNQRFWLIVFVYVVIVAAFVQLIALPYLFPQWNGKDGMLVGTDSLGFHNIALSLTKDIQQNGWSAWELRPMGQPPAAIAAIFYVLITPKPWTLIPLNAALHATSALLLALIFEKISGSRKFAQLSALPFIFFPSAMIWYTQIHNDSYSIAGTMCLLYGVLLIASADTWKKGWQRVAGAALLSVAGILLIWLVRSYLVQTSQVVMLVILFLFLIVTAVRLVRRQNPWWQNAVSLLLMIGIVGLMTPFSKDIIKPRYVAPSGGKAVAYAWNNASWLPDVLESKLIAAARSREGFRKGHPDAGSNIDVTISFHSPEDVVNYIPRALEIAYLAPFPDAWLGAGSLPTTTAMRRESAAEMIIVYLTLLCLPLGLWRWRKRFETWLIFLFSSGMMLFYSLIVANVGTLYRFRYSYMTAVMGLGIMGLAAWISDRKARKTGLQPAPEDRTSSS
jgi:hypothetical protein